MQTILISLIIGSLMEIIDTKETFIQKKIRKIEAALTSCLANVPDDSFLDSSEWRHTYSEEWKKTRNCQGQYSPDCSYVDDILNKDLTVGYLEVVISPILVDKPESGIGQFLRLIYKVDFTPGDVVRLYESSAPSKPEAIRNLTWEVPVSSDNEDYVDTDVLYDVQKGYSAEYVKADGKVILASRYYHDHSSWMWCMKDKIKRRPLGKLFLPGTHDSGSYTSPRWWQNEFYLTKIYYNYVFTQEDSVFSQLMQGARSLDLRVAKYINSSSTFYVNHNDFRIHPLKDILVQIQGFLAINPYEIIILDIHRFPNGFLTRLDHDQLSYFLKAELGKLIYEPPLNYPGWQVTPDDIWETKGRIVIAYNHYPASREHRFYPGVFQIWGAKDEVYQLDNYMNESLPKVCWDPMLRISCAMVELTPKGFGILTNKYKGLRSLASITNSLITNRFTVGSWGQATQAAAVDFIASTGIVTAAILQNSARTQQGHPCH